MHLLRRDDVADHAVAISHGERPHGEPPLDERLYATVTSAFGANRAARWRGPAGSTPAGRSVTGAPGDRLVLVCGPEWEWVPCSTIAATSRPQRARNCRRNAGIRSESHQIRAAETSSAWHLAPDESPWLKKGTRVEGPGDPGAVALARGEASQWQRPVGVISTFAIPNRRFSTSAPPSRARCGGADAPSTACPSTIGSLAAPPGGGTPQYPPSRSRGLPASCSPLSEPHPCASRRYRRCHRGAPGSSRSPRAGRERSGAFRH